MFLPTKNTSIPIVVELGNYVTRGGYAGEDNPSMVIPSVNFFLIHQSLFWIFF